MFESMQERSPANQCVFRALHAGLNDFISFLGKGSFYGAVAGETSAALVLRVMKDNRQLKDNERATSLNIRRPYNSRGVADPAAVGEGAPLPTVPSGRGWLAREFSLDENSNEEVDVGIQDTERLREFIRGLNLQLLQIAKPECKSVCGTQRILHILLCQYSVTRRCVFEKGEPSGGVPKRIPATARALFRFKPPEIINLISL